MTNTNTKTNKPDRVAEALDHLVTQVIASIEANPGNWTKPWADTIANSGIPMNTSGRQYTGGNVWLALTEQIVHGFTSGVWGTYNQWAEALGVTKDPETKKWSATVVRKGQKGTYLLRPQKVSITKDRETGEALPEKDERHFTMFRAFPVFNADQVEGGAAWVEATYGGDHEPVDPIEAAEAFISATGATVVHAAGGAFYQPKGDFINLPPRDTFVDAIAYYATATHELGHWSGAAKRLDRPGITTPAGEKTKAIYAFEELVAELTSVFVGSTQLGLAIEPRPENAQYLGFWVTQLKESPKILWSAAAAASKAATYLAELQPAVERELVAA